MKTPLSILALCAVCAAGLPSQTHAARGCSFASRGDISVGVSKRLGEIRIDNRRSRNDLLRMQRRQGNADAFGAGWSPVGLTLTELKFTMKVRVEAQPMGDGMYCARLTSVDADVGFQRLDVFIAQRFQPGTCAYASIHEHEMKHVDVFRETLDVYHPHLVQALKSAALNLGPLRARSAQAAAEALRNRLNSAVDPMFNEMNRTMGENNARLDTPERYRAEQARCAEW